MPKYATHIEDPEVVDRNHAALKAFSNLQAGLPHRSKDTRTKAIPSAIGDLDGLLNRIVFDDQPNRRED